MVQPILTRGNPLLAQEAEPVAEIDEAVLALVADMRETMHEARGAGLAANQIGVLKRVVVLNTEWPGVLINPVILWYSSETDVQPEGCLSIPGVEVAVRRSVIVGVRWQNLEGGTRSCIARDSLARLIQHEVDHLDGVLITDKEEKAK